MTRDIFFIMFSLRNFLFYLLLEIRPSYKIEICTRPSKVFSLNFNKLWITLCFFIIIQTHRYFTTDSSVVGWNLERIKEQVKKSKNKKNQEKGSRTKKLHEKKTEMHKSTCMFKQIWEMKTPEFALIIWWKYLFFLIKCIA